jgi:hypothetical protein
MFKRKGTNPRALEKGKMVYVAVCLGKYDGTFSQQQQQQCHRYSSVRPSIVGMSALRKYARPCDDIDTSFYFNNQLIKQQGGLN